MQEYWLVDAFEKFVEVWALSDQKYARIGVFGKDEAFSSSVLGAEVKANLIFVA